MIYEAVVHYKAFPQAGLPGPMAVQVEANKVIEALEDIFRGFNHAHPGVTGEMAERFNVRSMCVGDEVDIAGERWVCGMAGWISLTKHPKIVTEDIMIRMHREPR